MNEPNHHDEITPLNDAELLEIPHVDWEDLPPLSFEEIEGLEVLKPSFLLKIEQMVHEAQRRETLRRGRVREDNLTEEKES